MVKSAVWYLERKKDSTELSSIDRKKTKVDDGGALYLISRKKKSSTTLGEGERRGTIVKICNKDT